MSDDLKTLQARFFRLVTDRDAAPGPGGSSDWPHWLRVEDQATARERVQVYRDGYAFRCLDCLRDDFPAVEGLAGREAFARLVGDYVSRYPPPSPSLRHLGARFAGFAAESELGRRWRWVGELAALEWARVEAFDAAEVPTLTAEDLRAVGPAEWPSLRLRLAPSVRILELRHSIDGVWRALQDGSEPPEAPPGPTTLVVYRRAQVVYHRRVDAREGAALRRVSQLASFNDVCEIFDEEESVDGAAQQAFGALAQWMADGLMARS